MTRDCLAMASSCLTFSLLSCGLPSMHSCCTHSFSCTAYYNAFSRPCSFIMQTLLFLQFTYYCPLLTALRLQFSAAAPCGPLSLGAPSPPYPLAANLHDLSATGLGCARLLALHFAPRIARCLLASSMLLAFLFHLHWICSCYLFFST